MKVPFNALTPGDDADDIRAAIDRVVASGWFILGPEVDAFEREFAAASRVPHAVGVGTGTDAIFLIFRALDIGPGDEVITSPLSAAFSALAIRMAGARPVFADIDPERLTLDPHAAEAAITSRTRAIMPVHLYGQPADMRAFEAITARHNLALVEDAAQSHLATSDGRPVGSIGIAAATSFYPTKNLGALGDGGAVLTRDADLAARVKRLRNGGQTTRYHHEEAGVNTRLDELQAAILRARLRHLPAWTARRRDIAARYRAALSAATAEGRAVGDAARLAEGRAVGDAARLAEGRAVGDGARVIAPRELDSGHVYHLFPVLTGQRDRFQAHLSAAGVETLIHYPIPIPRQPSFRDTSPAVCPVADRVCAEVVSLPMYPGLRDEQAAAVAESAATFRS